MASPEQRANLVKTESKRIQQYLGTLSAEALTRPSACDRWEVRDVVAHLTGAVEFFAENISRGVNGDSSPPEGFPPASASALAARLEAGAQRAIALRESMGDQLLATFTARCEDLDQLLAGLGTEDWEKPCFHPATIIPVRSYIDLRLAELAIHEWDIRSKIDASAHLSSECLPAIMDLMPGFVVGRLFRPGHKHSTSACYRFELTGALPGRHDIVVENGESRMDPAGTSPASATINCDTETFALLAYGRTTLDRAEAEGRITVEGDRDLASQISG